MPLEKMSAMKFDFETNPAPDIVVRFGDIEIPACSWKLINASKLFKQIGDIVITTQHVQESTVRDFIKACQGEEVQLNPSNAQEFLALATEWQVNAMISFVHEYISEHVTDMIIPTILRQKRNNLPVGGTLITKLADNFVHCMSQPDVFDLGLETMFLVFESRNNQVIREHVHEVFNFLIECLGSGIEIRNLNSVELKRLALLANDGKFDAAVLNGTMLDFICEQSERNARLEMIVNETFQRQKEETDLFIAATKRAMEKQLAEQEECYQIMIQKETTNMKKQLADQEQRYQTMLQKEKENMQKQLVKQEELHRKMLQQEKENMQKILADERMKMSEVLSDNMKARIDEAEKQVKTLVEYRTCDGYDIFGYNDEGYNREGYDRHGYNSEGYNRKGYDREGYNREGYNSDGYNSDGYNRDGYNRKGYDCHGYNREGYDSGGYNRDGYDRKGYNRRRYYNPRYDQRK